MKNLRVVLLVALVLMFFSGRVFAGDILGDAFSTLDGYSGGRLGGLTSGVSSGLSNWGHDATWQINNFNSGLSSTLSGIQSGVSSGLSSWRRDAAWQVNNLGAGFSSRLGGLNAGLSGFGTDAISKLTGGVDLSINMAKLESSLIRGRVYGAIGGTLDTLAMRQTMLQDKLSSKLLGGKFGSSVLESKIKEGVSKDFSNSNWLSLGKGMSDYTKIAGFTKSLDRGIMGASDMAAKLIPRTGSDRF